jgi:Ca2+-binding RTX toxin-like protein
MRRTAMAVALLGLAVVAAPAANAASISYDPGGKLVVTAASGETNDVIFYMSGFGDGRLTINDDVAPSGPASSCEVTDYGATYCDWNPSAGVRVDLGDGNDSATVSSDVPTHAPFAISGGAGNDSMDVPYAGDLAIVLDGGPGDDKLGGGAAADALSGGDGRDEITARGGADALDGGAGDDLLSGDGNLDTAADRIQGGPGLDTIDGDWSDDSYENQRDLSVTLGGGADDGRPGEGDDVQGVEKIITGAGSRMVGTDAAEHLELFQSGKRGDLEGAGGDDVLRGGDAADRLVGGAGADDLDGGFGDDTIAGGPGPDTITGDGGGDCGPLWCKIPSGNDTIDARDGTRDSVTCGVGEDSVNADPADVVANDCENVTRESNPVHPGGSVGCVALKGAARDRCAYKAAVARCKAGKKARRSRCIAKAKRAYAVKKCKRTKKGSARKRCVAKAKRRFA